MSKPTLSGRPASQKECEIAAFIGLLNQRKVESYLEIGARHGDTFHRICSEVPTIQVALAVDLPGGPWGQENTEAYLKKAVQAVSAMGIKTAMFLGDSQSIEMQSRVMHTRVALHPVEVRPGVFDAILIDGDHRYEGVKRDFELWAPLARKLVAFHDIDGVGVIQKTQRLPVEVPVLWAELKPHYKHFEFIDTNRERPMGIGVLDVEVERAV